ncbi:hypothetical protein [Actibacterium sp. D379-3]
MKTFILTSAIALGLSAPAFADTQLERLLGVEPGVYTATQLVALASAADQTGNDARVYFGDPAESVARSGSLYANASVRATFAELAAASDDGNDRLNAGATDRGITFAGGRSGVNKEVIDIANELAEAGKHDGANG